MNADEVKKQIEAKLSDLAPLRSRMDIDRDIVYNIAYAMPSLLFPGKTEPDIANVTLPIGKLYSENCVSSLTSASVHCEVRSRSMTDKQTSKLEDLFEDLSYEINAYLSSKGEPSFDYMMYDFLCNRGSAGVMSVPRVKDGRIIPDVRLLDSHYLAFEFGDDGLSLLAPIYDRNKGDIKAEYGKEIVSSTAQVVDSWTPDFNFTWVKNELVRQVENIWGFVPGIFQGVSLGSSLKEANAIERKWESIFATSRDLYKEANFIASILKTQNYGAVKPALQISADQVGGDLPKTPNQYPPNASITPTEKPLQPVNVGDLKAYTVRLFEIINQLLNQATFSSLEITNLGQAWSAVAIQRVQNNRSKMQQPRFDAASQLKQRLFKLLCRQINRMYELGQIGSTFTLGEPGNERTYNIADLQGEYTINFSFYSQTSEDLAANTAVANAMGDLVSDDYKRRNILHLENPDGEKMKQRAELAERIDPVASLIEQLFALIDEGTDESDLKARRLLSKIEGILKQERLAETQPLAGNIERGSNKGSNPTQALPLFGGSQSKGVSA